MSHTFLHEAAHAVMAIDRDIPFIRIAVGTPENFDNSHADGEVAGGLYVPPPTSTWVSPNPRAALEMLLAGKVAEDGALRHHLEGGYEGGLLQGPVSRLVGSHEMHPPLLNFGRRDISLLTMDS